MSDRPTGHLPDAVAPALRALEQAVDAPRRSGVPLGNWRWVVRQRLGVLREALLMESALTEDSWLAARGGLSFRERNALLGRLAELGQRVLEAPDVEQVRVEVKRLAADISRHAQRVRDLAYDEVEVEYGGSE